MKALICGGRDYGNILRMRREIEALKPSAIIVGDASGADALARRIALNNKIPCTTFHADWKHEGRRAGPIRNQRMLEQGRPDIVLAFPGGKGTADMVRRARKAGVKTIEITP